MKFIINNDPLVIGSFNDFKIDGTSSKNILNTIPTPIIDATELLINMLFAPKTTTTKQKTNTFLKIE